MSMLKRWTRMIAALGVAVAPWAMRPAVAQTDVETPVPEARAATAEAETKFIRYRGTGDDEGALETATVTYRDADGREIALVSVVHIGDRVYYDRLNTMFKGYDAVLYEMIKPKDADPTKRGTGGLSFIQRKMKDVLDLDFQLDAIDYGKDNFVHADMTPEAFFEAQEQSGESLFKLMFKSVFAQWKAQAGSEGSSMSMFEVLGALMKDDSSRALKLLFAREMSKVDKMLSAMGSTVIIEGRNKTAMTVLKQSLDAGKRKIAIFYGGGHMPDLEKRLQSELGVKKVGVEWFPAWDVRSDETKQREAAAANRREL